MPKQADTDPVDRETIDVYDARASAYAAVAAPLDAMPLDAFAALLAPGARVLDWGCGPGHDAARFCDRGLIVDAVDASQAMVSPAIGAYGVSARRATFDDLEPGNRYDGVWANFSLLHATRDAVARHVRAAHAALVVGGPFYVSFKSGAGTTRDGLGRRYTYFAERELADLLGRAGFVPSRRFGGEVVGLDGAMAAWFGLLVERVPKTGGGRGVSLEPPTA